MSDVFTKSKRSEVMSRIRSRGNVDTEMAFIKLLRQQGIKGWRRHLKLPLEAQRTGHSEGRSSRQRSVKPDFVFRAERVAIFIDGCFWHSCPRHATQPKNNETFWAVKLAANRARDRYVTSALRRRGWYVVRIWEHQVKDDVNAASRLKTLLLRVREQSISTVRS